MKGGKPARQKMPKEVPNGATQEENKRELRNENREMKSEITGHVNESNLQTT